MYETIKTVLLFNEIEETKLNILSSGQLCVKLVRCPQDMPMAHVENKLRKLKSKLNIMWAVLIHIFKRWAA